MAILEMIPPEYWKQLRNELNALDWQAIGNAEDAARQQAEQAERKRREAEYDAAIRRKNAENRRAYKEQERERINAYMRERYARLKAERNATKDFPYPE